MAKVKKEKVSEEDLRKVKKTKVKKPRDIRSVFRETLAALVANGGVSHIKKPWMSTKDFRLLDTPETLQEWCDDVLANAPKFEFFDGLLPVVALDTETMSLDTRLFVRLRRLPDGTYQQYYEIKTDIGGICLSADGVRGVYIPINHEFQDLELTVPAKCIDRRRCAEILQKFFDQAHLVFYNGKFDREVLRLTMGNTFKPYPWFEDVQVLAYINDPKANLEDKKFYTGDAGGLKSLTRNILGIEQIELDEIAKVRAETCPDTGLPFCHCPMDSRKEKKHGLRNHFVPFSWVPVELALWYGGSDGICTWLLWERMYKLARSRRTVHRIDHELVDALSWIERQRFVIDVDRHRRTVQGHQKKIDAFKRKLYDLGIKSGYDELKTDEGDVAEKDKFNPGSPKQLQKLLYKVMKYPVLKKTPTGEASTDAETIEDLIKAHPEDEFLTTYQEYSDYKALHPGDLRFDSTDNSARIYLKQNVVAGGRLSSAGGEFEKDGGFGLNSQAVKKVESYLMWKVSGDILVPDPEEIAIDQIEEHPEEDLHSSCFQEVEEDVIIGYKDDTAITDDDSLDSPLPIKVPIVEKRKVRKQAPGIVHNHIGMYMGYVVCLVPGCKTCSEKYGILIPDTKIDANEVVNLRVLFCAPAGWTYFSIDWGNIEMRAAANTSGEPEFIKEFLQGKGDFHSLTASKVFPEFNDPNTSPAVKKMLRGLAKIINFALLYAGTAYTIFENMKKQKPDITFSEAEEMVKKYWEGTPVFKEWCQRKQAIARDQLICTTTTGRVINFQSAMDALHIHVPTEEERKNFWKYRDLKKRGEELKKAGNPDAVKYLATAQAMWKNLDTGVRNCMDYNKFMGKIQRVSVNAPLQGLAGDFMRMSLNKIHQWVVSDPEVASVILLHCSVHDEIDFSCKDEYVPFVVPRMTRLMKLRRLHELMKWPVPIETDAEYGYSWDVEHHVTGDDDHAAAAWTKIKVIANYLPPGCDPTTTRNLIKAIASQDPVKAAKADAFLKANLHPRAYEAAQTCFLKKTKKGTVPQTDVREIARALIASLQLDEYWTIDNTPDNEGDKLETLAQYEARNGLTSADRNPEALLYGPLGALSLDSEVVRPILEPLMVNVPPPGGDLGYPGFPEVPSPLIEVSAPIQEISSPVMESPPVEKTWELADLDPVQATQLRFLMMEKGDIRLRVRMGSDEFWLPPSSLDHIPDKFLKK